MPRVDIIMPTYKPGPYLLDSVKSIVNQEFQDWRLILVNDGSGSEFEEYISKINSLDDRIELISLENNLGGGVARNEGLKHINSDYIAFCDSDDIWPPDKLKKQIKLMDENPDINLTHCDMVRLENNSKKIILVPEKIDLNTFLSGTKLYCSSVVIKEKVLKGAKFGEMKARHPFKFWCSILGRGEISCKVNDTYFEYLVRKDSVSSNKIKMVFYTSLAYLLYTPSIAIGLKGMSLRAKQLLVGKN